MFTHDLINFIHLLSLGCWVGGVVFFSFFAAPAIFKNLDREQAGQVIGVIFPRYYLMGSICGIGALITLLIMQPAFGVRWVFLVIMLGCTLYAGYVVRPNAAKIKEELKSAAEDSPEKQTLEARFRGVHSLSIKLNTAVLVFGFGLIWITGMGVEL